MATTQEILELILKVSGTEEGKRLADQLERNAQKAATARERLDELSDAYRRGVVTGQEYSASKVKLEAVIDAEERARTRLEASLIRESAAQDRTSSRAAAAAAKVAAETEKNATFAGRYRQQLTQLGYATNDFFSTSGSLGQRLISISNNLGQSFGGIGLVLSGLVPIIAQVIDHWDQIKEHLTGVTTEWSRSIEGMKKKLSELEGKKIKIGFDLLEIETLKTQIKEAGDALRAFERLKTQQTEVEQEAGKRVEEALRETVGARGETIAGPEIARALAAQLTREQQAMLDPLRAEIRTMEADVRAREESVKRLEKGGDIEGARAASIALTGELNTLNLKREEAMKLSATIAQEAGKTVGLMIEGATRGVGEAQRARQTQLRELAGRAGLGALAGEVGGATAAEVRAEREFEEGIARRQQQVKDRAERRRLRAELLAEQSRRALQPAAPVEVVEDQQRVEAALQAIRDETVVRQRADQLKRDAEKRGLDAVKTYESVVDGLYDTIKSELQKKGIHPTARLVQEEARRVAGQAPEITRQARQGEIEAGKPEVARQIAREQAIVKQAGLAEQAQAMLARARAMSIAGGVPEGGEEWKRREAQAFEIVRQQAIRFLRANARRFKLTIDQIDDMATVIASMGKKAMDDAQKAGILGNVPFQQMQMEAPGMPMGPIGMGMMNQAQQMAMMGALPNPAVPPLFGPMGAGRAAPRPGRARPRREAPPPPPPQPAPVAVPVPPRPVPPSLQREADRRFGPGAQPNGNVQAAAEKSADVNDATIVALAADARSQAQLAARLTRQEITIGQMARMIGQLTTRNIENMPTNLNVGHA